MAWALAPAQAQDIASRAGTGEFQYLETLIFARPAGMAGAYTALAQGMDAVGYNPAGISKTEPTRYVSGTLRYSFLDITSGNVAYAFPGETGRSYVFSAAYINYGRIQELDESGNATGKDLVPASFNPSFSAAKKISDNLRLGATLKGLSEYLGDYEGSQFAMGWGVDMGLQYQPQVKNLGFGLALLNLGRKEIGHYTGEATGGLLPVSLKGGLYYYPIEMPNSRIALDVELPWHDLPLLSGGLEYAYSPNLTLRIGSRMDWSEGKYYLQSLTDQKPGEFGGGNALKLASGFTFQVEGLAFDYAVQYWMNLSWVHAMTIRYAVI